MALNLVVAKLVSDKIRWCLYRALATVSGYTPNLVAFITFGSGGETSLKHGGHNGR